MQFTLTVLIPLFMFLTLSMSCEKSTSFSKKEEVARINQGTPLFYPLADPDCSEEHAVKSIADKDGFIKVWLGSQNSVQLTHVRLSHEISGSGLQSDFMSEAIWGREVQYELACKTQKDGSELCGDYSNKVVYQGKRLFFCKVGGDYPRESLENVALASLVGMYKTYSMHHHLYPDRPLPKVTLLVHPRITDRKYTNNQAIKDAVSFDISRVRTDNAYWFLTGSDGIAIAAVPESLEKRRFLKGDQGHFWEMPSIMGHEYGHHMFHYYAPSLSVSSVNNFVNTPDMILASSAINEGFADLIAYFTYLQEYPDLGWFVLDDVLFNREVSKAHFSDGSEKALEEWFLHHYFRQTTPFPANKHQADPSDDHAVGAILAHGLYKIFYPTTKSSISEAFQKSVEWVQRMEEHFQEDAQLESSQLLEKSVFHAVSLVKENEVDNKDSAYCAVIRKVFPTFLELGCTEGMSP